MKFSHSMIRVKNLEQALEFFVDKLGLVETRRHDVEKGRFTLVFLATQPGEPEIELTYNWDEKEDYPVDRNFGHLAFLVDDIYATCDSLSKNGVIINRPPRDGKMAFVRSPDQISIELLQKGEPLLAEEPWRSMPNIGTW